MITSTSLLFFFTTSVLLALTPGPDNLFVMAQSARHGRNAGLCITLGLCTGLLVHTAAVTCGLAALFTTSTLAFTALKFTGAAYLLYLAWQSVLAGSTSATPAATPAERPLVLYRRGIIMNITNPKVSMFFLAFLPQFSDPSTGQLPLQLLLLGVLFIVATILVFGLISCFAGLCGDRFRQLPAAQKLLNRASAALFAGLAAKLVMVQR
jgi:threonine/homoserine/homoserine lactone efflux protein